MKKQSVLNRGFTLLELLVVVAILAIIAGALIASYDGLQDRAGEGVAARDIAALDQAVRNFTTVNRVAPDHLDSLIQGSGNAGTALSLLNSELTDRLQTLTLSASTHAGLISSLNKAGIKHLHFVQSSTLTTLMASSAWGPGAPERVFDEIGGAASSPYAASEEIDMYGDTSNWDGATLLRWKPNLNYLIGARVDNPNTSGTDESDIVLAFGLGHNSSLVSLTHAGLHDPEDLQTTPISSSVQLASAPRYGKAKPGEYGRYILLYNVGSIGSLADPHKAKLQAVVDGHGETLAEEIAEYNGK